MSVDLEAELAELGALWNATVPHVQASDVLGHVDNAGTDSSFGLAADTWPPCERSRSGAWVFTIAAVFVAALVGALVVESANDRTAEILPSDSVPLPHPVDLQGLPTLDAIPVSADVPLVLNQGASHGVKVGMPVVDAGGLIGRIGAVTTDSSVVLLLTDETYAVGAKVVAETASPTVFGSVEGQGAGLPLRLRVVDAASADKVAIGDVLVTAGGTESLTPGDIPIGTVTARIPPTESDIDSVTFEVAPNAELPPTSAVRIVLYEPGQGTVSGAGMRRLATIEPGEVVTPSTVPAGWTVEPVITEPNLHWEFTDPSRGALGAVDILNDTVRNEGTVSRTVTLDGNNWSVDESGISSSYSVDLGGTYVSVGGNGFDPAELETFITGLRAGPVSAHPGGSFDPAADGVVVAESGDDVSLSAAAVNGRFCWAVRDPEGSYVAQCALDPFDVDVSRGTDLADGTALLHVGETQHIQNDQNGDATVLDTIVVAAGITDASVQSVDVTTSNGVVLTVPTADLSGQFDTRFFVTTIAVPGDTQEPGPVSSVAVTPGSTASGLPEVTVPADALSAPAGSLMNVVMLRGRSFTDVETEIQDSTATCMSDKGFVFTRTQNAVGTDDLTLPMREIQQRRAAVGYGIVSSSAGSIDDPNRTYRESLSPDQQAEYMSALTDSTSGCRASAEAATYTSLPFYQPEFQAFPAEWSAALAADEELSASSGAWRACMNERGYTFESSAAAQAHVLSELRAISTTGRPADAELEELQATEIAIATADTECTIEHVQPVKMAVETALLDQWVADGRLSADLWPL